MLSPKRWKQPKDSHLESIRYNLQVHQNKNYSNPASNYYRFHSGVRIDSVDLAEWDDVAVQEFSELLETFKDRIYRDDWRGQAAILYGKRHQRRAA